MRRAEVGRVVVGGVVGDADFDLWGERLVRYRRGGEKLTFAGMKWPLMVAPVGGVMRRMPSGTAGNILMPSSKQADRYFLIA